MSNIIVLRISHIFPLHFTSIKNETFHRKKLIFMKILSAKKITFFSRKKWQMWILIVEGRRHPPTCEDIFEVKFEKGHSISTTLSI